MDKQLIERIANDVGIYLRYPYDEYGLTIEDLERFIAAIDAERGKQAEAWGVYWGVCEWRKGSVHFEKEEAESKASIIKSNTEIRPLFLSPAIPPGYALVPIEPSEVMLKAADDGDREYTTRNFGADVQTMPQGAYDHYCAMIAAAQGERNGN